MIPCLLHHANGSRFEVYHEPCIQDWEVWRLPDFPNRLYAGNSVWPALLFTIGCKPNIYETDPGPLDARLP